MTATRLLPLLGTAVLLLFGPPPDAAGYAFPCTSGKIPSGSSNSGSSLAAASWNTPTHGVEPASAPDVPGPQRLLISNWNLPVTAVPPAPPGPDPEGAGPVSVSVSDPVIGNEFFGIIDLAITGLSAGQSVLLEKFRVDNDQGVIDGGAILQESHALQDGVAAAVGEPFNWTRLYDVTERDGQIEVQLDFWEPSAASIPGEYVYRVSSPLGSFAPQTVRLTVTNEPAAQKFAGTVTAGGQPLPGAIVALLVVVEAASRRGCFDRGCHRNDGAFDTGRFRDLGARVQQRPAGCGRRAGRPGGRRDPGHQ